MSPFQQLQPPLGAAVVHPGRHHPGELTHSHDAFMGQRLRALWLAAGVDLKAAKFTVEQPNVRAVCRDTSGRVGERKDRGVDVQKAPAICSLSIHYLSQSTLPCKL